MHFYYLNQFDISVEKLIHCIDGYAKYLVDMEMHNNFNTIPINLTPLFFEVIKKL